MTLPFRLSDMNPFVLFLFSTECKCERETAPWEDDDPPLFLPVVVLGRFIGGGVVIDDGANNAASALTMPSALLRGDRRDDCDRDDDDNACDVHGPRRPRRVRCHKRGRRQGRGGSRRGHQRGRGKGAGGGRRKVRPLTVGGGGTRWTRRRIRTLRRIRDGMTTSAASAAAAVGTTIDDGRGSHRRIVASVVRRILRGIDDVVDVRGGGGTSTRRRTTSRRVRKRYEVSAVVIDVDVEIGRRCRGSEPKRALDEKRARRNSTEKGQGRGTETRNIWIGRPAGIGDDGTNDQDGRTQRRRRRGGRDEHLRLVPGQFRAYGRR